MKNNKMIVIVTILVAILIIGVIVLCVYKGKNKEKTGDNNKESTQNVELGEFEQINDDGIKVNVSSKLNEEKTFNGLKISNIKLSENNGETVLLADVENVSGNKTEDFTTIDVRFIDKEGNELGTLTGLIKPLEVNEKTELNASITTDLANSYDFEILEHVDE
ncbi:hypothetical protein IKE96_00230 [bacterium]|nr:hypothetical protein [bacterium]MBR3134757.1 hypothetical protein [Clostridia bacterium]